jgi:hypothetical protein
VSRAEIVRLVQSFARDYGNRNSRALGQLLTADVIRADAGSIEHGRDAVLAEYRSELADGSIVGYQVSGLRLMPGWTGRASAHYSVLRIGRATVGGQVTFGVERVHGHARIALIAIQPA